MFIMEHLVRLELTLSVWKTEMLTTNTKDAYISKIFIFLMGNLEWRGLYFIYWQHSSTNAPKFLSQIDML